MTPASLYRLGFRDHPAVKKHRASEAERKRNIRASKAIAAGRLPGKPGRKPKHYPFSKPKEVTLSFSHELLLRLFARLHMAASACECNIRDFDLNDLAAPQAAELRRKAQASLWEVINQDNERRVIQAIDQSNPTAGKQD